MPLGIHSFANGAIMARRAPDADDVTRAPADQPGEQLVLRIAIASLPLIGLVVGVVGLALWTSY